MITKNPYKRSLLCAAISLSLIPMASSSFAQQDDVEEVVVTGSFIRRTEGFRAASPVTQISADEIADAGTPNMGDIIHNLSFNQGTTVTANGLVGASNVNTSLNLRGLGAGATLDLTDGLRQISGGINSSLPYIGIQRMDIVTDGAAALYGSAAVAGVVNYVPYKSYDGFKFEHMTTMDDRGDYNDVQFGMLWGTEFNGIDVVVAADWRENGRLEMRDRPYIANSAFTWSSTTAVGDYSVPVRDENGNIVGSSVEMDPNCGDEAGAPTEVGNGEYGWVQFAGTSGERCVYDYGEFWDFRTPLQRGNLFASASYDFSNDLSINATYQYGRLQSVGRGSPFNPGADLTKLPTVRGEIPGNPFPAVDANGNQLYAQDANGDGVPDRIDANDPFSQVILSDAQNGIPFNEDVVFAQWRPWAKHGTKPAVFNSDGSAPQGRGQSWSHRYTLQADFTVPYLEGWEGRAAYMFAKAVDNGKNYDASTSAFVQGLSCDVANDRDACFSPFASRDPNDWNTQAVADSTIHWQRRYNTDQLHTFDFVINGELFPSLLELPGGNVGAAIGYQRRDSSFNDRPAEFRLTGDAFLASQQFVNSDGRTVDSFFIELAIPILENLELSAAVRDEDYSSGQSSTDPKYGIVYSPLQNLTLRASKGTSFIAPSLNQLNAPEGCGLNAVNDPIGTFNTYAQTCSQGNPFLVPETADTLSYGFDWDMIDGMRLSLTYSETDFTDRITTAGAQEIVNLDYANWLAANNKPDGAKATEAELTAWVNGGADPNIIRSPLNVFEITRVNTGAINASRMLVEAYDLEWRYSFELPELFGFDLDDLGSWRVSLQATYLDKFMYQRSSLDELEQAVGKRNQDSLQPVPPMPRIKANARIGWVKGNHSANLGARYIHDIDYDGFSGVVTGLSSFRLHPDVYSRNPSELRKYTVADFAYNYRGYEVLGGVFNFTIGSRNVFDRMPQRMPTLGGTEDFLYDTMGRTIYARVSYEL